MMEVKPTNTTKEWRGEWRRWIESFSDITHFQMHRSGLTNVLNDVDALITERDALAAKLADYEARTRKFASVLAEWGYDDAAKEVVAEILEGKPTPEAAR